MFNFFKNKKGNLLITFGVNVIVSFILVCIYLGLRYWAMFQYQLSLKNIKHCIDESYKNVIDPNLLNVYWWVFLICLLYIIATDCFNIFKKRNFLTLVLRGVASSGGSIISFYGGILAITPLLWFIYGCKCESIRSALISTVVGFILIFCVSAISSVVNENQNVFSK
ncbi:MAG: hypothetical protein FWD70_04700 [Desulfuromonadales bacterium]|nr:hypothetical protein [Desulfuromonadales bacterium]